MTLRILSGNGALQIMPFRKLGGKCHFFLRFCTRKRSKTYIYITKQKCIPVGCVPSAAVAICWGGVCPGGCLAKGGCLPRGVCRRLGGLVYPSMHNGRPPPPCEQNDRQTGVKKLPFRNFVCGQ